MSNHHPLTRTYLSIEDQKRIATQLSILVDQANWKDSFFLKYDTYVATASLALSGLSMWRIGFVAWNIKKYSRGRVLTLFMALSICPAGGLVYHKNVGNNMLEPFRQEKMWYYGIQAVLGNQLCLLVQSGFSLGYTFTNALMAGMMPVENNFLSKKHRMNTLKYVVTRLAPFTRRLIAINVLSSTVLFFTASRSYIESCHLLTRIGRKTIAEKED